MCCIVLQGVSAHKELLCRDTAVSVGGCEVVPAVSGAHHLGLCGGILHPLQRRPGQVHGEQCLVGCIHVLGCAE